MNRKTLKYLFEPDESTTGDDQQDSKSEEIKEKPKKLKVEQIKRIKP